MGPELQAAGATPVLVDVEPDTLNLDPVKVEAAITERTAAAGYTNAARHLVRPAGPALASLSMGMAAGLPFLVAGGLKVAYDLALFFTFRRVRLGDD